ncbi:MAG TPA: heme NO-binding domain-containing protein [Stellaceae bacterium]|nr:heme NO-binding domain-containing protein [Stellaceae bacterium]
MKGIIFNLLEEVVTHHHGEAAWDDLLDRAGLGGAYTSLGSYPDGELKVLVDALAGVLGLSPGECLRWFGRAAMPLLAERYPAFFIGYRTTIPFILSVNTIIHPEVRKIHPGAQCPIFRFEQAADGVLRLGYASPRRLCALAEGFIKGAADHFGETAAVEHLRCAARGDPECLLGIRIQAPEADDGARYAGQL